MEHIITKVNVDEAVAFVRAHAPVEDGALGLVLGSGLGELVDAIEDAAYVDYVEIRTWCRQRRRRMRAASSSARSPVARSSACRGGCMPTRKLVPADRVSHLPHARAGCHGACGDERRRWH